MAHDEGIGQRVDERAADVALGVVAMSTAVAGRAARPLLAAAAAVLTLGTQVVRVGPGDRAVVAAAARGEAVRIAALRRAEVVLGHLLRRGAALAVPPLDPTELARRHLDLDAVAAAIDVDLVVAGIDPGAVAARIDLDELAARFDPDELIARVDVRAAIGDAVDAALSRLDPDGIERRADGSGAEPARVAAEEPAT